MEGKKRCCDCLLGIRVLKDFLLDKTAELIFGNFMLYGSGISSNIKRLNTIISRNLLEQALLSLCNCGKCKKASCKRAHLKI